uniref:Uncharacterized protein n=1 Tax=Arundo donax TaxID=35708 RepID=A0A0A8XX02_ARUDO
MKIFEIDQTVVCKATYYNPSNYSISSIESPQSNFFPEQIKSKFVI